MPLIKSEYHANDPVYACVYIFYVQTSCLVFGTTAVYASPVRR